jgi:hypothetical protein
MNAGEEKGKEEGNEKKKRQDERGWTQIWGGRGNGIDFQNRLSICAHQRASCFFLSGALRGGEQKAMPR